MPLSPVPATTSTEAEGKIGQCDFRILAASEPVPNCTFFALPHVDRDTIAMVRTALLDLDAREFVTVDGEASTFQ